MRIIAIRSIIFITAIVFLNACNNQTDKQKVNKSFSEKVYSKDSTVNNILYGINIDSLKVVTGTVKKNQFLADILLKYGVSYATIDYIAKHTKDTFDVRKIRRGNKYVIITTNDSSAKPLYFVYELSPSKFVIYHLGDTVMARRGTKKIVVKDTVASGIIKTSLWNSMVESGNDPNLANELSEIYAWTIDFFGLQKGDAYKIYYTKLYVDNKYVGLGKVKAADFIHQNNDYYAFYFEQNGDGDYFDENGNSLERTFLKAPLKYRRISSRFSNSRYHPILKIRRPHHGVDYAAAEGTPVHSIGDGVVIKKGYQRRGAGRYVKIKHNGTYTTQYAHLRAFAKGLKTGMKVKQGQLIGYVGHTGLATGPHLDFRFFKNGRAIDPLKVKSPPAKPVDEKYKVQFDSLVKQYKSILDTITF